MVSDFVHADTVTGPWQRKMGQNPFQSCPCAPMARLPGARFFVRLHGDFGQQDPGGLQTVTGMWNGKDRTDIANSETTATVETQLALRQEDVGEGKQRLIRGENGIAILSLSRTKRELEKATEYRNSQRPGYYTTACCHRIQNLK